jgi:glycosyltransferase involved in cell wall biosynthesis
MTNIDSNPLISILTPTWNRAEYLKKVWKGLDSQTYKNIEWVIANDGSTDNTKEVVEELSKKSSFPVTFINADMRIGKPRMDNELMSHANGEFFIWNDSDDFFVPDAINRLVELWHNIPNIKRHEYLGVMALCSDNKGVMQTLSFDSDGSILDTTWEAIIANEIGDGIIMCRSDLIKNKRFLEVDFLITESSFWQPIASGMRVIFLSSVLKIMDRTAPSSISFGEKMEYNRGKAYAISLSDIGYHFYRRSVKYRLWKVLNYWRYSVLGELSFLRSVRMWKIVLHNPLYLLLYPVGYLLALRDRVKGKAVMTHRAFDNANKNVKITVKKIG